MELNKIVNNLREILDSLKKEGGFVIARLSKGKPWQSLFREAVSLSLRARQRRAWQSQKGIASSLRSSAMTTPLSLRASRKGGVAISKRDCFVAFAPRNDNEEDRELKGV
jgi:hypothetical protein